MNTSGASRRTKGDTNSMLATHHDLWRAALLLPHQLEQLKRRHLVAAVVSPAAACCHGRVSDQRRVSQGPEPGAACGARHAQPQRGWGRGGGGLLPRRRRRRLGGRPPAGSGWLRCAEGRALVQASRASDGCLSAPAQALIQRQPNKQTAALPTLR